MSDDEMMARFFASYVSPSERPVPVEAPRVLLSDATRAAVEINAAMLSAEPALPEGWILCPQCDVTDGWWLLQKGSEPRQVWTRFGRIATALCAVGDFPEAERFVLWKNGVRS